MTFTLAILLLAWTSETVIDEQGCPAGTVLVEERKTEQGNVTYLQPICRKVAQVPPPPPPPPAQIQPLYAPGFDEDPDFIRSMIALAKKQGWNPDALRRLTIALNKLPRGDSELFDSGKATTIWGNMRRRLEDRQLEAAAANGFGPHLFASGWQSGRFGDCALFALATGAAVPYGIVAARAIELLRSSEWRHAGLRKNPDKVFGQAGGLNGGEVIMLAEELGRVEVVELASFGAVLKSGRPILISLETSGGTGHEVVISRAFKHKGTDWYELADSQLSSPTQRLYLSATELRSIARENGVTLRPEPKRSIKLLRKPD